MAKTPEELAALREKLEAVRDEINNLSEDELKQIAGGDDESDCYGKCPKCGSRDVKQDNSNIMIIWTCNNCGYSWETFPA